MKIYAPDKSFTGESRYGDLVLQFKDGQAEHDGELPDAVRGYMQLAGYGLDEAAPEPAPEPQPTEHDPVVRVGTPLTDAEAAKPKRRGRKAAEPEPEPEPEETPDAEPAQDN